MDLGWLQGMATRGCFWFRIFGRGFQVRDVRSWPLVFSERNGRRWYGFQVGPYLIKWLPLQRAQYPW